MRRARGEVHKQDSCEGSLDSSGYGRTVRNYSIVIFAPIVFIVIAAFAFKTDSGVSSAGALSDLEGALGPVDSAVAETRYRASRQDPIVEALRSIQEGRFVDPGSVATGRCLQSFAVDRDLVARVDPAALTLERRGDGWIFVHATSQSSSGADTPLRLRFIDEDGTWKLEVVETLRRSRRRA